MAERRVRLTRVELGNAAAAGQELAATMESPSQFDDALAGAGFTAVAAFVQPDDGGGVLWQYLEAPDLLGSIQALGQSDVGPLAEYRGILESVSWTGAVEAPAGEPLLREVVAPDAERQDPDVVLAADPVKAAHLEDLRAVYDEITANPAAAREALDALDVLAESAFLVEIGERPWLVLYVESADWAATQEQYAASEHELDVKHRTVLGEALLEGGFELSPALHTVPGVGPT